MWYHVFRGLGAAFMAGITGASTAVSLAQGDMIMGFFGCLITTFLTLGVLLDVDYVRELSKE